MLGAGPLLRLLRLLLPRFSPPLLPAPKALQLGASSFTIPPLFLSFFFYERKKECKWKLGCNKRSRICHGGWRGFM